MGKNKTAKYFKYAIGEIVLVVIGILIALSINNWNQQRLNKLQAVSYLKNLAEDLKSDTIQFNLNIKNYKTDMANNSALFLSDDYKELGVDSLFTFINAYWMLNRISDQTFQKIKNTGLVETLGTEEINKEINDYYNLEITYYDEFLKWDKAYTNKDFDFWFYNTNFESSSPRRGYKVNALPFKDNPTKRTVDLIKLIESTEGRNNLRGAIMRDEYGIRRVNITKSAAKNLLELIDKELNKN